MKLILDLKMSHGMEVDSLYHVQTNMSVIKGCFLRH